MSAVELTDASKDLLAACIEEMLENPETNASLKEELLKLKTSLEIVLPSNWPPVAEKLPVAILPEIIRRWNGVTDKPEGALHYVLHPVAKVINVWNNTIKELQKKIETNNALIDQLRKEIVSLKAPARALVPAGEPLIPSEWAKHISPYTVGKGDYTLETMQQIRDKLTRSSIATTRPEHFPYPDGEGHDDSDDF